MHIFKGQLISKYPFGVFNFFQKTIENKSTWGIIVVKLNSFFRILEEFTAWQFAFEFYWPLAFDLDVSNFESLLLFLQASAVEKIKTNIRNSTWRHVEIDDLPRTKQITKDLPVAVLNQISDFWINNFFPSCKPLIFGSTVFILCTFVFLLFSLVVFGILE